MEQVLASLGIDLKRLEDWKVRFELDGDFPQIWVDRPWHPLTRREIYSLILVAKHMGFVLPKLALERIAFWVQLIELGKDFRAGKLKLQFVCMDRFDLPLFAAALGFKQTHHYHVCYHMNGLFVEIVSKKSRDNNIGKKCRNAFFLANFIDTKERYRIPYDPELEQRLMELNYYRCSKLTYP